MHAASVSAPSAFELIKKIQARPVILCADTGDCVAVRVDTFPQCGQYEWKSSVYYWYVPHSARSVSDLVRITIEDLASGFFVRPVNAETGEPIKPFKSPKT
jgi:hypothetical protein